MKKNNTYQCAYCGGIFEYADDWSDEDAQKEFIDNFPDYINKPTCIICDPCYKELMNA